MNLTPLARRLILIPLFTTLACTSSPGPKPPLIRELNNDTNPPPVARNASGTLGSIQRLDPALDSLLASDARLEILAEGVDWAEGPVWMDGGLLFSDVKQNTIYRWTAAHGVSPWLKPSGYLQTSPRGE